MRTVRKDVMLAFHECSSGSYAQEVIRGQPAGARVLECPLLALALSRECSYQNGLRQTRTLPVFPTHQYTVLFRILQIENPNPFEH